jgi:hypothetical protein
VLIGRSGMSDARFEEFVQACGPRLRRMALVLTGDPDRAEQLLVTSLGWMGAHWSRVRDRPEAYARAVLARAVVGRRGDAGALLRAYDHVSGEYLPHLLDDGREGAIEPLERSDRLGLLHALTARSAGRSRADTRARPFTQTPAHGDGPPSPDAVRREVARARLRRGGAIGLVAASLVVCLALLVAAAPALGRYLAGLDHRRADDDPLPATLAGRERLGLADVDLGVPGRAATVRVVPASLDLAVVVGCDGSAGIVDVRVAVNGRRMEHQACTGAGIDQSSAGGDTFEAYWNHLGVAANRPMTVTAQAVQSAGSDSALTTPLPHVRLALGVYGTPPPASNLPAILPDRPAGVPATDHLVVSVDLGPARRIWTLDGAPLTGGPFTLAVACAGPVDPYGYRANVGGLPSTMVIGACSTAGQEVQLTADDVRAGGGAPGRPLVLTAMMTTSPERPDILTGPLHAGAAVRVWLYEKAPMTDRPG